MKQYDILIGESGGASEDDLELFKKYVYWTTEEVACYNAAIDHAIAQINELAKSYPGGKTPSGEFFTNPTRDALNYAVTLISELKKPTV